MLFLFADGLHDVVFLAALLAHVGLPTASGCGIVVALLGASDTSFESHGPVWCATRAVDTDARTSEGSLDGTVGDVPAGRPGEIPEPEFGSSHAVVDPVLGLDVGLVLISTDVDVPASLFLSDETVSLATALARENRIHGVDVSELSLNFAAQFRNEGAFDFQRGIFLEGLNGGPHGADFFAKLAAMFLGEVVALAQRVVERQLKILLDIEQDVPLIGDGLLQGRYCKARITAGGIQSLLELGNLLSEAR